MKLNVVRLGPRRIDPFLNGSGKLNFKCTDKMVNGPEVKKKKKEVNFWLHPLLSNSGLCSIQTVCDGRALWDINDSRCDLNKHCFPVFLNPLRLPFCLYEFHVFAEKKKIQFVILF